MSCRNSVDVGTPQLCWPSFRQNRQLVVDASILCFQVNRKGVGSAKSFVLTVHSPRCISEFDSVSEKKTTNRHCSALKITLCQA